MDIQDVVSTEYESFPTDARVSKLAGAFEDPTVKGVVVTDDGAFVGVVTRRQLATSRHAPDQTLGSIVWRVPRIEPDEDVREVARLMIDGDSRILPVFEGVRMVGVVTADDLLRAVHPFLDAATVADAYTEELVTVGPDSTFGEALHVLRDHRITHLPVVDAGDAVGVLSLYDVTDVTVRASTRSRGGTGGGVDAFGGEVTESAARTHGGFGAREGELARILDLPVRDVMVSPVRTIEPTATLAAALEEMFRAGTSSLVVVGDEGAIEGIVTKTDVLDSLTWQAEGNRAVQVYGADLLDDVSYDGVVRMVEKFDDLNGGSTLLDAKVHLHEHDESLRGTPLLLARIRLYTDDGLYVASGEGYGARAAINAARDVLERQIRDEKTYQRSKKHPGEGYWEKRFGWWLEA